MLKQNITPNRQGELFKVSILSNQDDGPFLKKDVMHSNKRSLALLTGKGVLQNISHFNNSMVMMQTKTKQISSLFPENVDNITRTCQHLESQITVLFKQSSKLARQQKVLKQQLEQVFQRQKKSQQLVYRQCMPLLKNLFKTIKDCRSSQKDKYHMMERQIAEIQITKKTILEGIIQCQNRLIGLEQVIGYRTHDAEQDQRQNH